MTPVPLRVLYVEPDELNRRSLERKLATRNVTLVCVQTAEEASEELRTRKPDAVLCTWRRVEAMDVLLVADGLGVPIRIFSGWPAEPYLADRWILKIDPFALDTFLRDVQEGRAT